MSACLLVLCVCAGPKPRLVSTSLHSAIACGLPLPRSLHAVRLRSRWRCQRVGDQSTAHTPRTVACCCCVVGAYMRGLTSTHTRVYSGRLAIPTLAAKPWCAHCLLARVGACRGAAPPSPSRAPPLLLPLPLPPGGGGVPPSPNLAVVPCT